MQEREGHEKVKEKKVEGRRKRSAGKVGKREKESARKAWKRGTTIKVRTRETGIATIAKKKKKELEVHVKQGLDPGSEKACGKFVVARCIKLVTPFQEADVDNNFYTLRK